MAPSAPQGHCKVGIQAGIQAWLSSAPAQALQASSIQCVLHPQKEQNLIMGKAKGGIKAGVRDQQSSGGGTGFPNDNGAPCLGAEGRKVHRSFGKEGSGGIFGGGGVLLFLFGDLWWAFSSSV